MTRPWTVLLLIAWCLPSGAAFADGCFVGPTALNAARPSSAAQRAVLIAEGTDEVLLLQTTYRGPAARFAWIVPVPVAPTEVFAAEPAFISETFAGTEPAVATTFGRASGRRRATLAPPAPPAPGAPAAGAAGPGAPPVRVLQQTEVGDYRAVVLAATAAGALQDWLRANSYLLPAEAGPVLAEYVRKRWTFVALRMSERATQARPVLQEVPPLGLRFACPSEGLVYPLTISRLSAPPLTSMLLTVLGDRTYTCRTLPAVWLSTRVRLKRNDTYGALRRRLTRNPTRLLCEFSGEAPFAYTNLGYRALDWERGRGGGFDKRIATRFYGLLAREEMTDLCFAACPQGSAGSYRLLVRRRGPAPRHEVADALARLAVLAPGSGEQAQALKEPPRLMLASPRSPGAMAEARWRLVLVLVLFTLVVTLLSLMTARRSSRRSPPTALALPLVLGLALWGARVEGGLGPGLPALTRVLEAAEAFCRDTGAYPREVGDLAARQVPSRAQDASGNEVAVNGWRGPYLKSIPISPLRGGQLVCDPLNCFLIDSTGFGLTCEPATVAEARQALGEQPPRPTPYWRTGPANGARDLAPYCRWLQGRRGHHLFAFSTGWVPATSEAVTAVVVDRTAGSAYLLRGRHCLPGANGEVLTSYEAREGPDTGDGPRQQFGGLTNADAVFDLLPRLPRGTEYVALGPGGTTLVRRASDHAVAVVRRGAEPEYLPFSGSMMTAATLTPDGETALVSTWEPRRNALAQYDLRTRTRTELAEAVSSGVACSARGVLYVTASTLRYLPFGSSPVTLARVVPAPHSCVLALSAGYAYWASPRYAAGEVGYVGRAGLASGEVVRVARYRDAKVALGAESGDLYLVVGPGSGEVSVSLITAAGRRRALTLAP